MPSRSIHVVTSGVQMANRQKHEKMLSITHQGSANRDDNQYHRTPVRMAVIKKSGNNKCWPQCGEEGTLMLCWWE